MTHRRPHPSLHSVTLTLLAPVVLLSSFVVGCVPKSAQAPAAAPLTASERIGYADPTGLSTPFAHEPVDAVVVPPIGWVAEPIKQSKNHTHQVWLSPSGNTAYGVISFDLPWAVGPDWALWGFLKEMRETEGEATLLTKRRDPDLPGVRFVAEGGLYTVRTNLTTRGRQGWAVYAGTVRKAEVVPDELELAERAREQTVVDLPDNADRVAIRVSDSDVTPTNVRH
jgi:hypothetical protein